MRLKLFAAFGSAGLVLIVAGVALAAVNTQNEAEGRAHQAIEVRTHIRNLYGTLLKGRSALSSYLLFGDAESLLNARDARGRISSDMSSLLASSTDDAQRARLNALVPLIERNVSALEESLHLIDTLGRTTTNAFVSTHKERFEHVDLLNAISEARTAQEFLIDERRRASVDALESTRALLIGGAVIAFLLSTTIFTSIRRSMLVLETAHATIATQSVEIAAQTRALERNVNDLDQFAYVASHDLKAPLRGIRMLSQWIEEDVKDLVDDQGREHLQLMQVRVARMEALVAGALAYARAGRTPLASEVIDGNALVRGVIDMTAEARGGGTVVIDSPLPTIYAVKIPLQQIWLNLISNALIYGAQGGVVRVGAFREAGEVVYFVADKGPGIEPQFHDRIFGLFQTLSSSDEVEGTGIGLAVVKKLVEHQGGRVWLTSTVGEGTTFFFVYPDSEPSRIKMAALPPTGRRRAAKRGPKPSQSKARGS